MLTKGFTPTAMCPLPALPPRPHLALCENNTRIRSTDADRGQP